MRTAQDATWQHHADALLNTLHDDRHREEQVVEGFAQQIMPSGDAFLADPSGDDAMPTWARVLTAFPNFPQRLHQAAEQDAAEFA